MLYTAHINVMPLKELLDPQGKAVNNSLHNLGLAQISNVRIGKHITLSLEAKDKDDAMVMATEACQKLLTNQVMESYDINIVEA